MADISDWLTYPQAAKLTGIPRRTLERRVAEGRLVVASRRGGGRKPMSVLDPHGLQNLVAEEEKSLTPRRICRVGTRLCFAARPDRDSSRWTQPRSTAVCPAHISSA
jgi:excisionase family DNA binding protein